MKTLGTRRDAVSNAFIVELSQREYDALCRLAGLGIDNYVIEEIDLGPVLERLSTTKLARIIEILRHTADLIEKEDAK